MNMKINPKKFVFDIWTDQRTKRLLKPKKLKVENGAKIIQKIETTIGKKNFFILFPYDLYSP
jgi:hypothetical protein